MSRSAVINNFYTLHNDWRNMGIGLSMDWAPFQIDANMGWTAAMQEMLLYSEPGLMRLLPALPDRWIRGRVHGMLACGSIEVDVDWNRKGGTLSVRLMSAAIDQPVTMELPQGCSILETPAPSVDRDVDSSAPVTPDGRRLQVLLKAGEPLVKTMSFV
ncbi:glycoside hydrolase family 95-like protein [Paenibacillus mangrovi]